VGTTNWLDDDEARAWRALQLMNLRLDGELAHRLTAASGLSYQEYMVLVALTDSSDSRLRVQDLAQMVGWEKSRMSHQVSRMASRGLVTKRKCRSDRRGSWVVVTQKGRKEIEAAAPDHVTDVRQLFIDQLSHHQLQTQAEIAETVLEKFDSASPSAREPHRLGVDGQQPDPRRAPG
jgi:DNA-binding MarR family transcriptional regulator